MKRSAKLSALELRDGFSRHDRHGPRCFPVAPAVNQLGADGERAELLAGISPDHPGFRLGVEEVAARGGVDPAVAEADAQLAVARRDAEAHRGTIIIGVHVERAGRGIPLEFDEVTRRREPEVEPLAPSREEGGEDHLIRLRRLLRVGQPEWLASRRQPGDHVAQQRFAGTWAGCSNVVARSGFEGGPDYCGEHS